MTILVSISFGTNNRYIKTFISENSRKYTLFLPKFNFFGRRLEFFNNLQAFLDFHIFLDPFEFKFNFGFEFKLGFQFRLDFIFERNGMLIISANTKIRLSNI